MENTGKVPFSLNNFASVLLPAPGKPLKSISAFFSIHENYEIFSLRSNFVYLNMLKNIFLLLFLPACVFCQNFPAKPSNYVTDGAGILGPDEEYRLNAILRSFEDSSSIQIFVYTSPGLNNADMSDLCQQVFHQWKIGNKQSSNGVLIGIFVDDHKFRIHTGRGIEGVLPDLRVKKIQDEIMRPYFKENKYFMGLIEGVNKIMFYSKHEFKPEKKQMDVNWMNLFLVWMANVVLLVIFLLVASKKMWAQKVRKRRSVLTVLAFIFAFMPILGIFLLFVLIVMASTRYGPRRRYTFGNVPSWESSYSSSDSSSSDSSSSDSSSSDSGFDGGGGGDSGGGGSDSSW
jgi:uncharacterized protein